MHLQVFSLKNSITVLYVLLVLWDQISENIRIYSLLHNIQQGGVNALKALKTLYGKAPFLWLYFNDRWNIFLKIYTISIRRVSFAFMVVVLKQSIPFAVQTIPEVTFNGQWLAQKISDNIDNLIEIWLCVQGISYQQYKLQGIVTDNQLI